VRRLGLRRYKARDASVGSRPAGLGRTIVGNDGRLTIGDDVVIESTPVPGHLVTGPGGCISIGDRVRIGPGAAISAEDSVSIGDDAVLGSFVTIMDTDFHVAGDSSVRALAVAVVIEPGATIGHQAILLPGTRVGAGASVAPGSVVSGTVLPATSVAGNPAVAVDPDGVDDSSTRATSVGEVVARVFHLPAPARADLRPDDVPDWDSLGALRLLLALEAAFSVTIDEQRMTAVTRVGDLERLVSVAVNDQ
jgi:acetyltransferase-like isoleucine patch superfamily enzyme/acyl carrier protein